MEEVSVVIKHRCTVALICPVRRYSVLASPFVNVLPLPRRGRGSCVRYRQLHVQSWLRWRRHAKGREGLTWSWPVLYRCPTQADIPTTMGVQLPDAPMETDAKEASPAKAAKKYFIDSIFIHRPREGVEMKNPMRDCMSKSNCPHLICVRLVLAQKALGAVHKSFLPYGWCHCDGKARPLPPLLASHALRHRYMYTVLG